MIDKNAYLVIPTFAPLRRNRRSRAETYVRSFKIGHFFKILFQTASRAGRAELAELTEPAEVPEPAELAELSGPREPKRGKTQ